MFGINTNPMSTKSFLGDLGIKDKSYKLDKGSDFKSAIGSATKDSIRQLTHQKKKGKK